MANIITSCRIVCSVLLLLFPAFSPAFYILYCLAGITDMIDGTVARKTGTVSEFGSRLDTIADFVLIAVCIIKVLSVLRISIWLWIWIVVISGIKVFNVIYGFIIQKKFVSEHTIINKVTGAMLFVLPLTLSFVDLNYSGGIVCVIATIAAVHEGYMIKSLKA